MNTKRWLAIVAVVLLLFVSIGFQLVTSALSGALDSAFNFEEVMEGGSETIIAEGNPSERIAVLSLEGVIQDTGPQGFLAEDPYQNLLTSIDRAATDSSVKAIVLKVNSPGGGVLESAEIHRQLVSLKEEYDKPIYVSMGNTAASGGYYVAAPADKIYAEAATITGSIGVIMQSINFGKFAEKHGVEFDTITSGKHKDIMSPTRDMTDEEEEILQTMIDEMYEDFVKVIVDGRGMDEKKVKELADGRVYTGKQAKENNLTDEVGSFEDALLDLQEAEGLEEAQVFEYGEKQVFLSGFLMNADNLFKSDESQLIELITSLGKSESPRAMYLYSN